MLVLACSAALCFSGTPARARGHVAVGVYVGPANPTGVARFERWQGSRVQLAVDFLAQDDWSKIERPTWWLSRWRRSSSRRWRLLLGVPLFPRNQPDLAGGAAGRYDEHFRRLGRTLVRFGRADAILRLGWEFNDPYSPWYAGAVPNGPLLFADYWRRIVRALRSVAHEDFRFVFNPTSGPGGFPADLAWPGAAYVDYVGVDIYDFAAATAQLPQERWKSFVDQDHGLAHWLGFARAHHRPLALPEWGLLAGPGGGGDDPYFVWAMYRWLKTSNIVFAAYFNYGRSSLATGGLPLGAAVYRGLWGGIDHNSGSQRIPALDGRE